MINKNSTKEEKLKEILERLSQLERNMNLVGEILKKWSQDNEN